MSMDRYVYAGDNPERYTNPSGHSYIDEGGYYYSPSDVASLVASGQVALAPTVIPAGTTIIAARTTPSSSGTTSYRSPDVTLTVNGNDQYASSPTIGGNNDPACYEGGTRSPDFLSQALKGQPLVEVLVGGELIDDGVGEVFLGAAMGAALSPIPGLDVLGWIGALAIAGDGLANMAWGGALIGEGIADYQKCGYIGHT